MTKVNPKNGNETKPDIFQLYDTIFYQNISKYFNEF